MNMRQMSVSGAAVLLAAGTPAFAASHSWDIVELFSNAAGTIQFIELQEVAGMMNEINLAGKWVRSVSTGNQFDFPGNLPCTGCTADKYLLLATAGFAALPGAPTPDYIIIDGFLATDGDTIQYWLYDQFPFTAGQLPTDGYNSLNRDLTTGPNTPTNFAGETGTVNACPADIDHDGFVSTPDLLALLAAWGTKPGGPPDLDGGGVGTSDLLQMLAAWGPCG